MLVAEQQKDPITLCNSCTLHLVKLCYQRSLLFKLFREPLLLGMRLLGWWHRIDPYAYEVRSEACRGCIRFRKNALKEKSPTFRLLNWLINPIFNRYRDSMVTEVDRAEAKRLPRERLDEPAGRPSE